MWPTLCQICVRFRLGPTPHDTGHHVMRHEVRVRGPRIARSSPRQTQSPSKHRAEVPEADDCRFLPARIDERISLTVMGDVDGCEPSNLTSLSRFSMIYHRLARFLCHMLPANTDRQDFSAQYAEEKSLLDEATRCGWEERGGVRWVGRGMKVGGRTLEC